ncbi:MAG: multicopper oxidase domain-containing protein [Candidatus Margulisiibacteriota bacterium]
MIKKTFVLFLLSCLALVSQPIFAQSYTPVTVPNGHKLSYKMVHGVKEFHLTVEEIEHEFAPGMKAKCWGYNGSTPGPVIEAVEGDRVRILVTNNLKEVTSVHWHGVFLPNGMDGVTGLTQKGIAPGETFAYEFTLKQHGTFMYHSHGDEMVQMGLGTMGFLIVHPKVEKQKIDKDFVIFLNEWYVPAGTSRPDPSKMSDFNIFTFNSKVFPATDPLVVKTGDRVRIRFGNVGQESHPIHLHGHAFKMVATDGGDVPQSARYPETTVVVFPGQTRDVEFIADAPGDWPLHCHRRHHPMNTMGHESPNMIGVDQSGTEEKIQKLVPDYMAMGENGMDEMTMMSKHMPGPDNTLPMMAGDGPFGDIGMGGMFTILKVRDKGHLQDVWYQHPKGTVAEAIGSETAPTENTTPNEAQKVYTCPMHPEIQKDKPGSCPKCGMTLVLKKTEPMHSHHH